VQQLPVSQQAPVSQHEPVQAQSPPTSHAQPASTQTHSVQVQTTQQSHGDTEDVSVAVEDRKADKAIGDAINSARTDIENVFMEILQRNSETKRNHRKTKLSF
jgi:hypothetical protein